MKKELPPLSLVGFFAGAQRTAMEWLVYVANQMYQPGQIHRTCFRKCFGVCAGLFTIAGPVKNVVGAPSYYLTLDSSCLVPAAISSPLEARSLPYTLASPIGAAGWSRLAESEVHPLQTSKGRL
jgi:hypothetical protein